MRRQGWSGTCNHHGYTARLHTRMCTRPPITEQLRYGAWSHSHPIRAKATPTWHVASAHSQPRNFGRRSQRGGGRTPVPLPCQRGGWQSVTHHIRERRNMHNLGTQSRNTTRGRLAGVEWREGRQAKPSQDLDAHAELDGAVRHPQDLRGDVACHSGIVMGVASVTGGRLRAT